MALHNRPNGNTAFTDDPAVAPATGVKIDADLNALTAIVNSLDNANFSGSPKLASSKIDLTTGGYVPLDGSADMTATLKQAFDGIFRELRADGNAKIYDYQGTDGALWGVSYNTYWTGSAWSGRDTTAICARLTMEADGLHYYHAVSGASGTTPSWTEVFHINASGRMEVGTPRDNSVTEAMLDWANAGGISQDLILETEITHTGDTNWTEKLADHLQVYIPSNATSLEYVARIHSTSGGVTASCRLAIGATDGTAVTSTNTVYEWTATPGTIDISALSGWQSIDVDLMIGNGAHTCSVDRICYRII